MLKKSIKHEFRATSRVMLPVYLAILALSVVTHFAQRVIDSQSGSDFLRTVALLTMVIFFIGLAAVGLSVIALAATRFYRSFLSDEGYLTMTLPVNTHKLISSRLIVSVVWYALTALVCLLSVFLMAMNSGDWSRFFRGFGSFVREVWKMLPDLETNMLLGMILCAVELFLCLVLGAALASLLLYAAMAIGHSFNRHKKALSVVFGLVFYYATQIAAVVSAIWIIGGLFAKYERAYAMDYLLEPSMTPYNLIIGVALALLAAACVLFYFLTHYFLTRKLNLE